MIASFTLVPQGPNHNTANPDRTQDAMRGKTSSRLFKQEKNRHSAQYGQDAPIEPPMQPIEAPEFQQKVASIGFWRTVPKCDQRITRRCSGHEGPPKLSLIADFARCSL